MKSESKQGSGEIRQIEIVTERYTDGKEEEN